MKKQDQKENDLMRDLFSRQEVFEPSSSFTEQVMYRVSIEKSYYSEIYRPLISKTAWIVIAVSVLGLIVITILLGGEGTTYTQYLPDITFDLDFNLSWISSVANRMNQLFHDSSPVVAYIIFGLLAVCVVLIGESLSLRRIFQKQ